MKRTPKNKRIEEKEKQEAEKKQSECRFFLFPLLLSPSRFHDCLENDEDELFSRK